MHEIIYYPLGKRGSAYALESSILGALRRTSQLFICTQYELNSKREYKINRTKKMFWEKLHKFLSSHLCDLSFTFLCCFVHYMH